MRRSVISKLTSKGQVTVPESIRAALRVRKGDRIEWRTGEGSVEVRRVGAPLSELAGLLSGGPRRPLTVEDMDQAIAKHLRKKHGLRR